MGHAITSIIFQKLLEGGKLYADAFLPPQYSFTRPSRRLLGLDMQKRAAHRTISSTLSRLKKQGLVAYTGGRRSAQWLLTKQGEIIAHQKYTTHTPLRFPKPDGKMRLVIFDIPERKRYKRNQIRVELIAHSYTQLQKSVWMGMCPLTKEFITLLDTLDLKDYVHIFSVQKTGTLENK